MCGTDQDSGKSFTGHIAALVMVALATGTVGYAQTPASAPASGPAAAAPPPNIVLFLADDLRWNAPGFAGNPSAHTPLMDLYAHNGVWFSHAFTTTSICAISRASIVTGQYASRHGIRDFTTPLNEPALEQSFPAQLRRAGYTTGFIGKWGIGTETPSKLFDYWDGFADQGEYFPNGGSDHLTAQQAQSAKRFMQGLPARKPFLLWMSFKAPHAQDGAQREFPPDPALEMMYLNTPMPVPESATPEAFNSLPEFIRNSEGRRRWERRFADPEMYQRTVRDYMRLVTGIDNAMAVVRGELIRRRVENNTVIIITSDNGFLLGDHGLAGKWLMYDPSIRLPLVIFDLREPAEHRGRIELAPALNLDLAPTILELAGLAVPDSVQGRSLVPWLKNRKPEWRSDFFYEHPAMGTIPQSEGVREEQYKYVRYPGVTPIYEQLFDLKADPEELTNLAGDPAHAETLNRLRTRCDSLKNEVR